MSIIGIDLDSDSLKIAKISKSNELKYYKSFELTSLNAVKRLDIDLTKSIISAGLDSSEVILKIIPFNLKKIFIKKALEFQCKNSLSLNTKSMHFCSTYNKDKNIAAHFITTKEVLTKRIKRDNHLGLDPDHITYAPIALIRFAKFYDENFKEGIIINFSKTKVVIVLFKDFFIEKSYQIKIDLSKSTDYKSLEIEIFSIVNFLDSSLNKRILFTGDINFISFNDHFSKYLDRQIINNFFGPVVKYPVFLR